MPYEKISDLPTTQVDQYTTHQKHAFLKAFNNAYGEYGGDESRAFAVAHSAAKKAGETGPHPSEESGRSSRAER
jgi:cation transport regulator